MMRLKLNDGDGEGMVYVIHRTTKKDGFEADSEIVFNDMVINITGYNEESYWKLIECLKEFNRNVY